MDSFLSTMKTHCFSCSSINMKKIITSKAAIGDNYDIHYIYTIAHEIIIAYRYKINSSQESRIDTVQGTSVDTS